MASKSEKLLLLLKAKDEASKVVSSMKSNVTSGLKGIVKGFGMAALAGGALAGVITGSVVVGLQRMIRDEFSAIDATAKLFREMGISTEALQSFRHAAELNGASANDLDKGLRKMMVGIGEAQQDIGTAKKAFDELGISLDDISGLSPEEQFKVIADAIAQVDDKSQKAALANQIFGRSGRQLINTLNLGTKGLEEIQAEAEKLGIAYNAVDAAKIEQANDAVLRMQKVFQGVQNTIAIELAPYVEGLANKVRAVSMTVIEFIKGRVVPVVIENGKRAVGWFQAIWPTLKAGFFQVMDWVKAVYDFVAPIVVQYYNLVSSIYQQIWQGIKRLFTWIGNLIKPFFGQIVSGSKSILTSIKEAIQDALIIAEWGVATADKLWDNLVLRAAETMSLIKDRDEWLGGIVGVIGKGVRNLAVDIDKGIGQVTSTFFSNYAKAWKSFIPNIKKLISGELNLGDFVAAQTIHLTEGFKDMNQLIGDSIQRTMDANQDKLKFKPSITTEGIQEELKQSNEDIISGLAEFLEKKRSELGDVTADNLIKDIVNLDFLKTMEGPKKVVKAVKEEMNKAAIKTESKIKTDFSGTAAVEVSGRNLGLSQMFRHQNRQQTIADKPEKNTKATYEELKKLNRNLKNMGGYGAMLPAL